MKIVFTSGIRTLPGKPQRLADLYRDHLEEAVLALVSPLSPAGRGRGKGEGAVRPFLALPRWRSSAAPLTPPSPPGSGGEGGILSASPVAKSRSVRMQLTR